MRVLVCITDFGTSQRNFLWRILAEMNVMYPHYAFDVKIYTTEPISQKDIERFPMLRISEMRQSADLKDGLTWCHRAMMIKEKDNYDLFIYTENDILIAKKNLDAFVNQTLPDNYVAGFIHYEVDKDNNERLMPLNTGFPSWGEAIEISGHKYATLMNQHQACYILTKKQLRRVIASGNYATEPHIHNHLGQHYHYKETSATSPYTICGLQKVIPVKEVSDFILPHLPNHYVTNSVSPLFSTPFYTLKDFIKRYE